MELQIVRANPSGNITLFVLTPVPWRQQEQIAKKLLSIKKLGGEQVGFIREAEEDCDGWISMSGGEFCGNAARAFGMLLARERGFTEKTSFRVHVSGCKENLTVSVDPAAQIAESEMPLDFFQFPWRVCTRPGTFVHLGGIAHYVAPDVEPSQSFFEAMERELASYLKNVNAYGVVFLDTIEHRLTPLVKVPATNSLFWEGSCGSGSTAAILAWTAGFPDGTYHACYHQPAGTINASVTRQGGQAVKVSISGDVTLSEVMTVEI